MVSRWVSSGSVAIGGGGRNVDSRVTTGGSARPAGTSRFNYGRLREQAIVPAAPFKGRSLRNKICNEAFSGKAIVYGGSVAALGGRRARANGSDE